jgi:hypothetical protein
VVVSGYAGDRRVEGSLSSSPPPGSKKRPSDEVLRKAIESKAGIVSAVAEALGVDVRTVQRWKQGSQKVFRMFEDVLVARLDLAESTIIKAIRRDNITAAIFYLKCHGKHRGWVERHEITGKDGGPIGPSVEEQVLRSLSDEEIRQLSEIMEKAADRLRPEEGKGPAVAPRVH